MVDVNAQRLKRPLAGLFDRLLLFLFRQKSSALSITLRSFVVVSIRLPRRISSVIAFASSSQYGSSEFSYSIPASSSRDIVYSRSAALMPFFLIQSQIQRAIHFEGKAALRIIDLHRRHSQIRQNEIKSADLLRDLVDRAEILQPDGKNILPIAQLLQTLFVLADSSGSTSVAYMCPSPCKHSSIAFCVSAVAQRRIKAGFPG